MSTPNVYNYVNSLITDMLLAKDQLYNFMLVCGGNPIKGKYGATARVIFAQLTNVTTGVTTTIMPDELDSMSAKRVNITDNHMRKLGERKGDFTVLGNTLEKCFRDSVFFDYSYSYLNRANKLSIEAIKNRYDIRDVVVFQGVEQTITLPDMDQVNDLKLSHSFPCDSGVDEA